MPFRGTTSMGSKRDRLLQRNASLRRGGVVSARLILAAVVLAITAIVVVRASGVASVGPSEGELLQVWGRRGLGDGRLQKPRAMAIQNDELYLVDMTARIQVFDLDGNYLRHWQTPTHTNGRPSGLSFDREGRLLVADTHYYRVLIYSPEGELLDSLGGVNGQQPGEFGFVTDAVQDSQGNYFIAEYGEFDRVQKLAPDGTFILQWGGHGEQPGQFLRPQSLAIDDQDRIWVADACNHRVQVFNTNGELLFHWGTEGTEPGQMRYPYDLVLDPQGNVYISEFGNHRIQKFTSDGESLGCWGTLGRQPGELNTPWALVLDDDHRVHVLDTLNHRVQCVSF